MAALLRLLPRTDVFHFYFGLTLVPQLCAVPDPPRASQEVGDALPGSDIRGKTPAELAFGKKASVEVVGSYDAIRWVPEAEMIPPGIDLKTIEPAPPSDRTRPVILHAPSSRPRKGTEHVVAACESLDADLVLVEGLHHDDAFERYREADIVVDQLNAGWYGLFAIECMALGKPVVTFLHDEAVRRTKRSWAYAFRSCEPPRTTSARASSHSSQTPPSAVGSELESRAYVEQVHDLDAIADRLLALSTLVWMIDAMRSPSPGRELAARGAASGERTRCWTSRWRSSRRKAHARRVTVVPSPTEAAPTRQVAHPDARDRASII